jgi:HEPN domain-containing protein
MNNIEVAKEGLERGKQWQQNASRAFEDDRWNDVVFSYEMAVEQSLKAILILFGIEYPKIHNISKLYLGINKTGIPKWFVDNMDFHANILKTLVNLRNKAAYGYVNGLTKEDFKEDAYDFQDPTNKIINDCETLINDFSKKAPKG